jgi:hypothetical protein
MTGSSARRRIRGSGIAPSTSPVRILYIGGLGRSGSTLLQRLLERCDDVVCVGELAAHFWQRGLLDGHLCGCGTPVPDCAFWGPVAHETLGLADAATVRALQRRTDRERYLPWILSPRRPRRFQQELTRYSTVLAALYRNIAARSGSSLVVDSSKQPTTAALLKQLPATEVRIVHLVRDPRGVALSRTRELVRPEVTGQRTLMRRWSPRSTAWKWVRANLQMEILKAAGCPTLVVRYEDLVRAPIDVLQRVCQHAGIEPPRQLLAELTAEHAFQPTAAHSVSGNPIRFSDTSIVIREDGAWKQQLPFAARRTVATLTAPLALRYGYRLASDGHARPRIGAPPGTEGAERTAVGVLAQRLWPGHEIQVRRAARGPSLGSTYAILPHPEHPRVLVPLGSRRATAAAVAGVAIDRTPRRAARVVIAGVARLGCFAPLVRHRLVVRSRDGLSGRPALEEHLREVTGLPIAEVCIRLGTPRPNQKPVLQLFDARGHTIGFAKIGHDELTRHLVTHEADTLRALDGYGTRLEIPRALSLSQWNDLAILVQQALRMPRSSRRGPGIPDEVAALRELSSLDAEHQRGTLGASAYATGLQARLTADNELGARSVATASVILARAADEHLRFGRWHGDLRPWNVAWRGRQLLAWDWERSEQGVPVGLDAIHYHHPSLRPGEPADALARRVLRGLDRSRSWLRGFGVPATQEALLLQLHLLELVARHLHDPPRPDRAVPRAQRWLDALDLLERR